jgi:hypothetical protein
VCTVAAIVPPGRVVTSMLAGGSNRSATGMKTSTSATSGGRISCITMPGMPSPYPVGPTASINRWKASGITCGIRSGVMRRRIVATFSSGSSLIITS